MKLLSVAPVTMLCIAACSDSHSALPAPNSAAGMVGVGGTGAEADAAPDSGPATPVLQHASPIISRGAHVFSSPAGGAAVVDGSYHNGGWSVGSPAADAPAWVAIQLTSGPSRLLVVWDDGGTYNYQDPTTAMVYGLPRGYRIEVSSDSTNGADGTWASRVEVTDNDARTRGHAIDFGGQSWVKLVVTAAPPNAANGVAIAEIDVHDISSAPDPDLPEDTWLFMGDSITAFAYDRALIHQPSFAAGINTQVPGFFPAMINAGIGGEKSTEAVARITQTLALNPNYHFVILGYGTNDAANSQIAPATFKTNLQTLIDRVKAAGRVPLIPHIPVSMDGNHASIPLYNAVIDQLTEENQLLAGADLYAYFTANAGLFSCPPCANGRMTDNLHPNDDGLAGMNAVWTSALRGLYQRAEP